MTSEEIERLRAFIKKRGEEIASSPESARAHLYQLGTHNLDGSLTKQYGGEYTDRDHPAFIDD